MPDRLFITCGDGIELAVTDEDELIVRVDEPLSRTRWRTLNLGPLTELKRQAMIRALERLEPHVPRPWWVQRMHKGEEGAQ